MIKGFNSIGKYSGTVADINHYAFDAYHDQKHSDHGIVGFFVMDKNADIECKNGTNGRFIISGDYGKESR
jgi:hypothetical protein